MAVMIWYVIIIAIVINMIKTKKGNHKDATQARTNQQYGQPDRNKRYAASEYTAPSQEELKDRLQAKYKDRIEKTAKTVTKNIPDILAKATLNAGKYEKDELHEMQCGEELDDPQMHAPEKKQIDPAKIKEAAEMDTSSLMKDVEKLMITGYQSNMEFERDFLGEAMDMLNSFTSPS